MLLLRITCTVALTIDNDGYADVEDACNDDDGTSWIDRKGCNDYDQDGWSNNNFNYFDGDFFTFNWKLASDSDGDGYGDNSGADCCITEYDSSQPDGDLFPFNPSQYKDQDGDGWGDNSSDPVDGDACKWDWGASWRDRKGCLDTDLTTALQTHQPVEDSNGTLHTVQMLGHLMALNGQIPMATATETTVQKVLQIQIDSLTT